MIRETPEHEGRALALMRYASIGVAILLIGVSIAMITVALGFPTSRTLGSPGPAKLPIIYASILIAVSIGIIAQAFTRRADMGLSLHGMPRALALAAGTALCIYLWSIVGFLTLFVPATLIAAWLMGGSMIGSIICAAVLPLSVYGLFRLLLNIPFP